MNGSALFFIGTTVVFEVIEYFLRDKYRIISGIDLQKTKHQNYPSAILFPHASCNELPKNFAPFSFQQAMLIPVRYCRSSIGPTISNNCEFCTCRGNQINKKQQKGVICTSDKESQRTPLHRRQVLVKNQH